jgi:hypothetical protein
VFSKRLRRFAGAQRVGYVRFQFPPLCDSIIFTRTSEIQIVNDQHIGGTVTTWR